MDYTNHNTSLRTNTFRMKNVSTLKSSCRLMSRNQPLPKHLGKSIDLRDTSILRREEFGHWELDTVRGSRYYNYLTELVKSV